MHVYPMQRVGQLHATEVAAGQAFRPGTAEFAAVGLAVITEAPFSKAPIDPARMARVIAPRISPGIHQ